MCSWVKNGSPLLDAHPDRQYYQRALQRFYNKEFASQMKFFEKFVRAIFSQENLYAVLAFLILVALVLFTASTTPAWIYQGF